MAAQIVRVGILGDFNPQYHSHVATNASIEHAARASELEAEAVWVATPSLLERGVEEALAGFDCLWASPGSPYRSMQGMLAGIERARVGSRPFLAT